MDRPSASDSVETEASLLRAAYGLLDDLHRAPCRAPRRVLLLCLAGSATTDDRAARLSSTTDERDVQRHGIANDLNAAVRAFALGVSWRRQLVVPDDRWFWLGEGRPLHEVLVESACARHVPQHQREWTCAGGE